MQGHSGHVSLYEQIHPLLCTLFDKHLFEFGIDFINMLLSTFHGGITWVISKRLCSTGSGKKTLPMSTRITKQPNIAVSSLRRVSIRREWPRVAPLRQM